MRDSEFNTNEILASMSNASSGKPSVPTWQAPSRTQRKTPSPQAKHTMGWNQKAFALASLFFVSGAVTQSNALLGIGCAIMCFGVRPYWK